MPASVNSFVSPVPAAQVGSTPTVMLQPGTVVEARVLSVLEGDLVQIAIANIPIAVQSQVPLEAGAALRLAVSQTADGIQLAIVPPGTGASQSPGSASGATGLNPATDTSAIARPATAANVTSVPTLTTAEAAAVISASQAAVARQGGLSGLFANLAATVDSLPAPLQQAAANLLATRPALTTTISGGDIQAAFQNSGLFLETGLAGGPLLPGQAGGPPDLKAALLVFRQLLSVSLEDSPVPSSAQTVNPAAAVAEAAGATEQGSGTSLQSSLSAAEMSGGEVVAALLLAGEEGVSVRGPSGPNEAGSGLVFDTPQETDGAGASQPGAATWSDRALSTDAGRLQGDPTFSSTALPPPPYRGAAPTAQSVASPSIAADATTQDVMRRLADDTNGALARQTLLQIASLPGQGDAGAVDRSMPRWYFEVPFATPQGTAVAQFEISKDGGGQSATSGEKVWRARFSLDVEPTGPVHAVVSLSRGATSVRMWAERPQTAAQLRANASQLSFSLRQADIEPGDIVIGDGAPPLPAAVRAGYFLNRAT